MRVVHHAMIAKMEPILDRALVADTFACRPGKGTLAAVQRAQHHARRFPWCVKADVRSFFASIDHARMHAMLERRFKNAGLLALCRRILDSHHDTAGAGLPIGALTSQHFANLYLAPLDRLLLESLRVRGMVRYMDDAAWWCTSRDEARRSLAVARSFAEGELHLSLHADARVAQSERGLSFLGFCIYPGTLKLSRRRRRRYRDARKKWEGRYGRGELGALELQSGGAAAVAVTAHADAIGWRRRQLALAPPPEV